MPNFNAKKTKGIRPFDKMLRNLALPMVNCSTSAKVLVQQAHFSGEHCRAFALTPPTADGKKTKLSRGGIP
jgi:hypothetical protein